MKKIMSMLISLCVLLQVMAISVQATDDSHIFELEALQILQGDYNLEGRVTRGDAAVYFTRLLGMGEISKQLTSDNGFVDIEKGSEVYNSVSYLKDMRYVSGVTDTEYMPDMFIDKYQVSAILVRMLGYEKSAAAVGTYPENYLIVAGGLGILDGINSRGSEITLDEFARMMYNSLDISMLVPQNILDDKTLIVSENDTLRINFEKYNENMFFESGVVTANAEMYTLRKIDGLDDNEVHIDNVIYEVEETINTDPFMGMKVDFYYYEENGRRIINKIRLNEDVNYADIDLSDITEFKGGVLRYYAKENSSSTSRIKISQTAAYVLNFDVITRDVESLLLSGNGLARLIDNDGDDSYDTVLVKRYSVLPVDIATVNDYSLSVVFKNGYKYNNRNSLTLNLEDDDVRYRIFDKDGNPLLPTAIKKDCILSLIGNNEGTSYRIYVSDAKMDCTLDRVTSEGKVHLAGEEYTLCDGLNVSEYLGKMLTVYFTHDGKIAYVQEYISDEECPYAVVISSRLSQEDGENTVVVKLGVASSVNKEQQESGSADLSSNETQSTLLQLAARNSSYMHVLCADSVILNGKKEKDASTIAAYLSPETAIKFEVNDEGEISRLDVLQPYASGRLNVNASDMTFYGNDKFGIDAQTTYASCFPANNDLSSLAALDYTAKVELKNGASINVKSYDYNEETHCAKFFVVKENLNYAVASSIKNTSPVGIVKDSFISIGEDDLLYKNFVIEGTDGEKEFNVSEEMPSYTKLDGLGSGMFIAYSLDTEKNIGIYNTIADLDDLEKPFVRSKNGFETYYGTVENVEYKKISDNAGKWVDVVSVSDGQGGNYKDYEIRITQPPHIFIYEVNDFVKKANNYDIMPGDKVVIYSDAGYNVVLAVAIIK